MIQLRNKDQQDAIFSLIPFNNHPVRVSNRLIIHHQDVALLYLQYMVQGGSNMTGTDLCVNKPHCAAAVRP